MPLAKAVSRIFAFILISATIPAATGAPVLYRLDPNADYTRGCLKGPCDCAVQAPVPAIGTFKLELHLVGPLYTEYALTDINWYVSFPEGRTHFRGQGTYRVGGEVAVMNQLEFTLTDDEGNVRHFDSDLVPGGTGFPQIDVQAWKTASECVDAAIHVVAEPAPYTVYRLGQETTYLFGCTGGICTCPVSDLIPMRGTFLLVLIAVDPFYHSIYALTDIRWMDRLDGAIHISGGGLYTIGGQLAVMHQLELDILVEGETSIDHLDSGLLSATDFPAIDILASTHTLCFNRIVDLQARPAGDFNLDGSVDMTDYAGFTACVTGPGIPHTQRGSCQATDIDGDGDTDQSDFGLYQRCFGGPAVWMDPHCGD